MSLVTAAERADTAFQRLPVIDLTGAGSADEDVQRRIASTIRDACMEAGFFYVKNHGVPQETIDGVFDAMQRFFALPLETKMAIDMKTTPNFKGYNGLFSATNDAMSGVADAHEGFECGWEALGLGARAAAEARAGDVDLESNVMAGGNVWPEESAVPGFRAAVMAYYHAAVALGKRLFPLFARALDLPPDFFTDKTRRSAALLRLIHYPPRADGPADPRTLGIGAHTDWECFTILWQQPGLQALEVRNTKGEWIDAPSVDGTFVVNIGDMLARWTNDVFKSNFHRALSRTGARRYSIPLFFGTDYHVLLEPIASCVSPARPPKYDVITSGELVRARAAATYGHQ